MAVHRIVGSSLSIAMLFAVFAAVAQTNNPVRAVGDGGKFRAACAEDVQRFCGGVQPGGGRLVQCLSSNTARLSAECGNIIASNRGGGKFRAACGEDVQRFCGSVQPGGGRLVECLSSHTTELSPACGNRIAATQVRGGISNPGARTPTTQPDVPVTVAVKIGSILRASCGPDVQKLCAGARREGEVLKCLESQRMELSTTCSLYFQRLGRQPIARENAPTKKRPSPAPTTPIPVQDNASDQKPPLTPPASISVQENAPSPTPATPIPVQDNASDQKPLLTPPASIPVQENAPSTPSTTPIPVRENTPNRKPPSRLPAPPIPD
jgi:Cysteine rich repeat